MCGRFALTAPASSLVSIFDVDVLPKILPRYNIAPSQDIPAFLLRDGKREASMLKWGLIPSWAKDKKIGWRTTNARSETASKKPAFRSSWTRRRCLVPMTGYYEWQTIAPKQKPPHLIDVDQGNPFAVAGLWARWSDPESDDVLETVTLLTTDANPSLAPIHNRMPVILDPEHFDAWLDPDTPLEHCKEMMRALPSQRTRSRAVSTYVSNARNQGEACQADPDAETPTGPKDA